MEKLTNQVIFRCLLPRAIPFIRKYAMKGKTKDGILFNFNNGGLYNGYVAIPPTNSLYGKDDEEFYDIGIDIHGGVTFSRSAKDAKIILDENVMYILSSCKEIPSDWWIIGFDTKHYGDTPTKWTRARTIQEALELYRQVIKYSDGHEIRIKKPR